MPPQAAQQDFWNVKYTRLDRAVARMPRRADDSLVWGNVKVAHLDTGYTPHPALGFDAAGRSPWVFTGQGRDVLDNRPDPRDPLIDTPWQPRGHGTRTLSALCGIDAQITGLAPRLPVVPYRVNEDSLIGRRDAAAIGAAIRDADRNGCQICSISLGFPLLDEGIMGEAVDEAYERGILVIAACGQMTNKISYPAKHRRAIGVGGVKRKPGYALYYPYERYSRVDIFAPADPIWRADVKGTVTWDYGFGDGTSYAVPHVVASAAIWLALRGAEIRAKYRKGWMRIEAFRKLLRRTQQQLRFPAPPECEARALNADALVQADLPDIDETDYEKDRAGDDRF